MVNEQRISSTMMVFVTSNSPELHLSLHARNNMLLDPPGIAYLSSRTHSTHVFSITHTSEPEHNQIKSTLLDLYRMTILKQPLIVLAASQPITFGECIM